MKNIKVRLIAVSLIVLTVVIAGMLFVKQVRAYTFGSGKYSVTIQNPGGFGEGGPGINTAIGTVFNVVITISEIAFVLLFLIGGIMYLTSMGDEEASKKAKKLLVDAVIGLVIVLAAWAIGTWILNQLKGKGGEPNTITPPTTAPNQEVPQPAGTTPPVSPSPK